MYEKYIFSIVMKCSYLLPAIDSIHKSLYLKHKYIGLQGIFVPVLIYVFCGLDWRTNDFYLINDHSKCSSFRHSFSLLVDIVLLYTKTCFNYKKKLLVDLQ